MAETKSDKKYRGQEVWTGPFRVLLRLAIVIGILIFPVMIYWPNYQDWKMRSGKPKHVFRQIVRSCEMCLQDFHKSSHLTK